MGTEHIVEAGGAPLARIREGAGPVVAFALHAGHDARPELLTRFGLSEDERLREEDPFTAQMAPANITLVEVLRSRFEVDLNRPRFRAVYQGPQDAWGLDVWNGELPDEHDRISRACYDTFYATAFDVLSRLAEEHPRFVVLDVHSYNHRREGADGPAADPAENPEVNLGTGRLDRERWAPVVEAFSDTMTAHDYDCRENVKFRGGHFAHWIADTFPDQGCALAIEFKKTYMDEWSGAADHHAIERNRTALARAVEAIEAVLAQVR